MHVYLCTVHSHTIRYMCIHVIVISASIVLTHFGIRSHADILENELVQLTAKAFVSNVNVDARGGVVAGEINISNAQIGCKSLIIATHSMILVLHSQFSLSSEHL